MATASSVEIVQNDNHVNDSINCDNGVAAIDEKTVTTNAHTSDTDKINNNSVANDGSEEQNAWITVDGSRHENDNGNKGNKSKTSTEPTKSTQRRDDSKPVKDGYAGKGNGNNHRGSSGSQNSTKVFDEKKFVEAPPPKMNAWAKKAPNTDSASENSTKSSTKTDSVPQNNSRRRADDKGEPKGKYGKEKSPSAGKSRNSENSTGEENKTKPVTTNKRADTEKNSSPEKENAKPDSAVGNHVATDGDSLSTAAAATGESGNSAPSTRNVWQERMEQSGRSSKDTLGIPPVLDPAILSAKQDSQRNNSRNAENTQGKPARNSPGKAGRYRESGGRRNRQDTDTSQGEECGQKSSGRGRSSEGSQGKTPGGGQRSEGKAWSSNKEGGGQRSERGERGGENPSRRDRGGSSGRRRTKSTGQGKDLNDSTDWPSLEQGTEKDAQVGAEGAGVEATPPSTTGGSSSPSAGVRVPKPVTSLSPASNAGSTSETNAESKEGKSRNYRKKGSTKWKVMPIELPKTERRRGGNGGGRGKSDGGEYPGESRRGERGEGNRSERGERRDQEPRVDRQEARGERQEPRGDRQESRTESNRERKDSRGEKQDSRNDREPRSDRDSRGDKSDTRRERLESHGDRQDSRGERRGGRDSRGGSTRRRGGHGERDSESKQTSGGGANRRGSARGQGSESQSSPRSPVKTSAPVTDSSAGPAAAPDHSHPSADSTAVSVSYRGGRGGGRRGRGDGRRGGGMNRVGMYGHVGEQYSPWAGPPRPLFYMTPPQLSPTGHLGAPPTPVLYPERVATGGAVMFSPVEDQIVHQIEYYFSEENLEKDFFLRRQMDGEGWISVDLITRFRRVVTLGADHDKIVTSMKRSTLVETSRDGQRMRCKQNPARWVVSGVDPTQFSTLKPTAAEFVPFSVSRPRQSTDKPADTVNSASEVSTVTASNVTMTDNVESSSFTSKTSSLDADPGSLEKNSKQDNEGATRPVESSPVTHATSGDLIPPDNAPKDPPIARLPETSGEVKKPGEGKGAEVVGSEPARAEAPGSLSAQGDLKCGQTTTGDTAEKEGVKVEEKPRGEISENLEEKGENIDNMKEGEKDSKIDSVVDS